MIRDRTLRESVRNSDIVNFSTHHITRAWQKGLSTAHFGDTVLLVPKKKLPKITNWPIIQEDSRKIIRFIIPHF